MNQKEIRARIAEDLKTVRDTPDMNERRALHDIVWEQPEFQEYRERRAQERRESMQRRKEALQQSGSTDQSAHGLVKFYDSPDDTVEGSVGIKAVIDPEKVRSEQERLKKDFNPAKELDIIRISIASERDLKRFEQLGNEIAGLANILATYHRIFEGVETGIESISVARIARDQMNYLGASLLTLDVLDELKKIATRNGKEDGFAPVATMLAYGLASEVAIQIEGVTLRHFVNFRSKTDSPVPYYRFLMHGALIPVRKLHHDILSQQPEYPYRAFPNTTLINIDVLPNRISSLLDSDLKDFKDIKGVDPLSRRVGNSASSLIEGVNEVRNLLRAVVLNPQSPHFPALKEVLTTYLYDGDKAVRIWALYTLGITTEKLFEIYRNARRLKEDENHGDFYQLLCAELDMYTEEAFKNISFLTKDDIPSLLDLDSKEEIEKQWKGDEVVLKGLGGKAAQIINTVSQRSYVLDPQTVKMVGLPIPAEVWVDFDQNRPQKFMVSFSFNNEFDEQMEIDLLLDTPRMIIDWNIREDPMIPEDQNVALFRNALLLSTGNILDEVQRQASELRAARQRPVQAQTPGQPRGKRERYSDPIYEERKRAREERRQTQKQEEIQIVLPREAVKYNIRDNPQVWEEAARHIPGPILEELHNAVIQFRETGTGLRIKKLQSREPTYSFRRGNDPYRIIAREIETEKGIREFNPLDIDHRSRIYRRNKL